MSERNKTMTSLEVAAITGIKHGKVKETIEDMESAWKSVNGKGFRREPDVYLLSKAESLFIAARFAKEERKLLSVYWEIFE